MRTLVSMVALLATLLACQVETASTRSAITIGSCDDVTEHGAIADDGLDDRVAFQDAINACSLVGGGAVTVPQGTFDLSRYGTSGYSMVLADGVTVRGAGQYATTLLHLPGIAASVRMFYTAGAVQAGLADLTLDGNKSGQSPDGQRHGVFIDGADGLRLERLNVRNFTGDGVYLYHGAADTVLADLRIEDNDRNGITFGGASARTLVTGCTIRGNAAQQIDGEPGPGVVVADVTIAANTIIGGSDYAVAFGGSGSATQTERWVLSGNRITGGVFVVWARQIVIDGNLIRNATTKPGVYVYRSSQDVIVSNNSIELLNASATQLAGVFVAATSESNAPDQVVVSGNTIKLAYASNYGIDAQGVQHIVITGNMLRGAGQVPAFYAPIRVRATVPVRSAIVTDNTAVLFGTTPAVLVVGTVPQTALDNNVVD